MDVYTDIITLSTSICNVLNQTDGRATGTSYNVRPYERSLWIHKSASGAQTFKAAVKAAAGAPLRAGRNQSVRPDVSPYCAGRVSIIDHTCVRAGFQRVELDGYPLGPFYFCAQTDFSYVPSTASSRGRFTPRRRGAAVVRIDYRRVQGVARRGIH